MIDSQEFEMTMYYRFQVFCSTCCNMKSRLPYMKNQEVRVCVLCHSELLQGKQNNPGLYIRLPQSPMAHYCYLIVFFLHITVKVCL